MSMDGQGTKCRRNIAENYKHLSRMHERYRQQTDRRQADGRQHIATGRRQGVFSTLLRQSGMRAFHWWHSGNKKRTQNVSEYMLVLALCLVGCLCTKSSYYLFRTFLHKQLDHLPLSCIVTVSTSPKLLFFAMLTYLTFNLYFTIFLHRIFSIKLTLSAYINVHGRPLHHSIVITSVTIPISMMFNRDTYVVNFHTKVPLSHVPSGLLSTHLP